MLALTRALLTPVRIAGAGTVALVALSFVLSFAALTDLAERSGVAYPEVWPLIVDGLIIVATVAAVALRTSLYAWLLLASGALISIAGNVVHAILPDGPVAPEIAAAVAGVPPVALLAVTHLTVILARHSSPAEPQPTTPEAPAPEPASALFEIASYEPVAASPVPVSALAVAARPAVEAQPAPRRARTHAPASAHAEAEALFIDQPSLSNRAIGTRVGVSETTIRRWRKALAPAT